MAVLLSRIQNYRPPADNSGSEANETIGPLRMRNDGEGRNDEREPGEIGTKIFLSSVVKFLYNLHNWYDITQISILNCHCLWSKTAIRKP